MSIEFTRVIFRADRRKDFEVTAMLPDQSANQGRLCYYAHIGQHGEASYAWYHTTRAATPKEYAPLLAELRRIYEAEPDPVRLVVRKRIGRPLKVLK
jgi:hypothetical protein